MASFVLRHGRKIEVETADLSHILPKKRARKPRGETYITLPIGWLDALDKVHGELPRRILNRLLVLSWKEKSVRVKATNKWAKAVGVTRAHGKLAALRSLEQIGLISVEWRRHKSPIVTILYPKGHPALPYMRENCVGERHRGNGHAR